MDTGVKWAGGVRAISGMIYGIPCYSTTVLKIDPTTDTATTLEFRLIGPRPW